MCTKGIGYQEYRRMRRVNEGLTSTALEASGNERYALYFGRSHILDFETGVLARGHLKIGRAKFITALQRGRNQPGVDFRIYAEIILGSNEATHDCEKILKDALEHRNIRLTQGQSELYDYADDEIRVVVATIAEIIRAETGHGILEINLFEDNRPISILEAEEAA